MSKVLRGVHETKVKETARGNGIISITSKLEQLSTDKSGRIDPYLLQRIFAKRKCRITSSDQKNKLLCDDHAIC